MLPHEGRCGIHWQRWRRDLDSMRVSDGRELANLVTVVKLGGLIPLRLGKTPKYTGEVATGTERPKKDPEKCSEASGHR